jgi:hypothetical protein
MFFYYNGYVTDSMVIYMLVSNKHDKSNKCKQY